MRKENLIATAACVPVLGLAIWVGFEHQMRNRLEKDRDALEEQAVRMAELMSGTEHRADRIARSDTAPPLPDDHLRELLRLRGEVGMLRQETKELETVRDENRRAHAALESSKTRTPGELKAIATADYWPRDAWVFSGFASPDAALQSSLWAANNGDLKTLAASATGEARQAIEAELGGKSEVEASVRAMDEVMSFKAIRILNREIQSADTVMLTVEFEGRTETHTGQLVMKKVGGDWKLSRLP